MRYRPGSLSEATDDRDTAGVTLDFAGKKNTSFIFLIIIIQIIWFQFPNYAQSLYLEQQLFSWLRII